MLAYVGVFFMLAVSALAIHERNQKSVLIFFAIFLLWYMGARNEVGCDWWGYLHRFLVTRLDQPLTTLIADFDEPGFWLITKFVRDNDLSYMWLNMISSAIILICIVVFCRAHKDSLMILALLFPVVIVQLSMSGIRQGLATGFLMVASVAWVRGSKLRTAMWIIIGSQFHTSVVMFLPIAALAGRKVTTKWLFGSAAILGPIAMFLLGDRFDTYSSRYLDNSNITSSGALIRYVLLLIPAIYFLVNRKKLESAYPESYQLMRLTTAIVFSLIPVAIFSSILLHRVIYFVMPLSILTFVAIGRVGFPRLSRGFAFSVPVFVYGSYMVLWFFNSFHASYCYLPYKNSWSIF